MTSFERYAKIIKLLERATRERSENEVWKNLKKFLTNGNGCARINKLTARAESEFCTL